MNDAKAARSRKGSVRRLPSSELYDQTADGQSAPKPLGRAKRRRTQDERSDEMRKRLLAAGVKVLTKRGYLGFTTLEAARLAGVTRGAPLHHFGSSDAFRTAAVEQMLLQGRNSSERAATQVRPQDDVIEALLADARDFFFSEQFFAGVDALNTAAKDSRNRLAVREWGEKYREPVEHVWRDLLTSRGLSKSVAEDAVWLAFTIVRGLAIRTRVKVDSDRVERTLQLGVRLLRQHLYDRTGEKRWLG